MYIGDDETDEDAFRVVRERGLSIVVCGEDDARPTLAQYALRDTDEALRFLELLIDLASTRRQT
jgi:trehalose 6-phosphate phosphatase